MIQSFFHIAPPKFRLLILFFIAFAATWLVFRPALRIAKSKNIVDNPNARKLQKTPIPVLGGCAVFFGIVFGMCFFKTMMNYTSLFPVLGSMTVMLYLGTMDDITDISPKVRFVLEVLIALLLVYGSKTAIVDFQGLWGIGGIPVWLAVALTVLMFVGVVNSINMVDGVDGLCSSFCILICAMFGLVFFLGHNYSFAALAAVCVGALCPFFLHNVFGWDSKMFLGDGGTMVMGTAIASMVLAFLNGNDGLIVFTSLDFSKIAFCLAVLAIPVADTLRVMTVRIFRRQSPFHPDKNHLHHKFITIGFSHIATTAVELFLALVIIGAFAASYFLGAGVDVQLYTVIAAGIVCDYLLAIFLDRVIEGKSPLTAAVKNIAAHSSVQRKGIWLFLQKIVDGKAAIQEKKD